MQHLENVAQGEEQGVLTLDYKKTISYFLWTKKKIKNSESSIGIIKNANYTSSKSLVTGPQKFL